MSKLIDQSRRRKERLGAIWKNKLSRSANMFDLERKMRHMTINLISAQVIGSEHFTTRKQWYSCNRWRTSILTHAARLILRERSYQWQNDIMITHLVKSEYSRRRKNNQTHTIVRDLVFSLTEYIRFWMKDPICDSIGLSKFLWSHLKILQEEIAESSKKRRTSLSFAQHIWLSGEDFARDR